MADLIDSVTAADILGFRAFGGPSAWRARISRMVAAGVLHPPVERSSNKGSLYFDPAEVEQLAYCRRRAYEVVGEHMSSTWCPPGWKRDRDE